MSPSFEGFSSSASASDEELEPAEEQPPKKKLKLDQESEPMREKVNEEEILVNETFPLPSSATQRFVNADQPSTPETTSFPTLKDVVENQSKFQFSVRLKLPQESSSTPSSTQPSSSPALISTSSKPTFPVATAANGKKKMEKFSPEKVVDFKHVVYNLLVDFFNDPIRCSFAQPIQVEEKGKLRHGFCFNSDMHPEKKIPELYAENIRKDRLDVQDFRCVCIQDLYKFYFRAAMELLGKYFDKHGKYAFLYKEIPLFVPEGSLEEASNRIKQIKPKKTDSKRKRQDN